MDLGNLLVQQNKLTDADLQGADLTNARFNQYTRWTIGFDAIGVGAVFNL